MADIIREYSEKATKDIINVKATTMEELRSRADILAEIYTEAYNDGNHSPEIEILSVDTEGEVTKADVREYLEETVKKYGTLAQNRCFKELKATADPMLEAVKRLVYPTIRIAERKDNETGIVTVIVEDAAKQIDSLKLHKFCGGGAGKTGGIGKDHNWVFMAEKFNCLLTAQKAKDLGLDPKEVNNSYAMNQISKSLKMGENPTSNTNILRTLNTVVAAMIGGEFKAVSHDVNFLKSVYSKKGKGALVVACSKHSALRGYLMEICHRIVMGKTYGIDYKRA